MTPSYRPRKYSPFSRATSSGFCCLFISLKCPLEGPDSICVCILKMYGKANKPCSCSLWLAYVWCQETTSEIYGIDGPEGLLCHLPETWATHTDGQFTTKDMKSCEIFLFKKEYHHRYCECAHDDLLGAWDDTPGEGPAGKGGAHLFSHISALVSPATVSSLKAARLWEAPHKMQGHLEFMRFIFVSYNCRSSCQHFCREPYPHSACAIHTGQTYTTPLSLS